MDTMELMENIWTQISQEREMFNLDFNTFAEERWIDKKNKFVSTLTVLSKSTGT